MMAYIQLKTRFSFVFPFYRPLSKEPANIGERAITKYQGLQLQYTGLAFRFSADTLDTRQCNDLYKKILMIVPRDNTIMVFKSKSMKSR